MGTRANLFSRPTALLHLGVIWLFGATPIPLLRACTAASRSVASVITCISLMPPPTAVTRCPGVRKRPITPLAALPEHGNSPALHQEALIPQLFSVQPPTLLSTNGW